MLEFKLEGSTIAIGEADVESIRQAVVDRLTADKDSPNASLFRSLADELTRLSIYITPDDARIGHWVLTDREGQLAFVRIPARGAVNYLFVATLERKDGRWVVTDFFQEVMKALESAYDGGTWALPLATRVALLPSRNVGRHPRPVERAKLSKLVPLLR